MDLAIFLNWYKNSRLNALDSVQHSTLCAVSTKGHHLLILKNTKLTFVIVLFKLFLFIFLFSLCHLLYLLSFCLLSISCLSISCLYGFSCLLPSLVHILYSLTSPSVVRKLADVVYSVLNSICSKTDFPLGEFKRVPEPFEQCQHQCNYCWTCRMMTFFWSTVFILMNSSQGTLTSS